MPACNRCRGENGKEIGVVHNGSLIATGALCDDCLADCTEHADRMRNEFELLVESGIARDVANAIMIMRMEGRIARA